MKLFLPFILLLVGSLTMHASDLIFQKRVGTSLNKVSMYTDSSYSNYANVFFQQGELFEIIGETFYEHEDDSQNQKFKWFQIKSKDGKTGWIFGDGIAVIVPENEIKKEYKSFNKQKTNFSSGFEKAVTWIGAIKGHDNFHEKDYLNPIYEETYLVLTNERGNCVFINIAGQSEMGKTSIVNMQLKDLTNDDSPEIIMESTRFASGDNMAVKSFVIQSVQAGTMVEILNEVMTLEYSEQIPSPAFSKYIEVIDELVRVEYVDYVSCNKYNAAKNVKSTSKTMERCMEYVTYTYIWNERKNSFELIYPETRDYIVGGGKMPNISVYKEPSLSSNRLFEITPFTKLKIIKHFETIDKYGSTKKITPYFLVRLSNGKEGFVKAKDIGIVNIEHAELLNQFYNNPPLSKTDWKSEKSFLKIIENTTSSTGKY